jgi:hypothetical protein
MSSEYRTPSFLGETSDNGEKTNPYPSKKDSIPEKGYDVFKGEAAYRVSNSGSRKVKYVRK